jgi:hypothetical protein
VTDADQDEGTEQVSRYTIFIHDPHITSPFVGIAPVRVVAEDEWRARSAALEVYNRVATGTFTEADIGFAARLADLGDHGG